MSGIPANRKLHVLQVTGEPVGGIRKHVHSILSGLDPATFKQSYAWSSMSCDARFQLELERLCPTLGFALPLPIRKKPHFSDLANLLQLASHIRRHQVDIVHGHGAKGGVYARALHLLCGIKAVYTPHGGSVHPLFSRWESCLYGRIERVLFPLTDYFIFESRYTATAYANLVGHTPDNMIVNYNGIQAADQQEIMRRTNALCYSSDNSIRIGVFAMLRSIKGQKVAIDAVRLLNQRGCPVSLHLFGDGADRQALTQLCAEYHLDHQVVFHGDVADVLPHMNAMDIVLIPSLFESFGYVAVEALTVGKYIIASRVGGLPEVLEGVTDSVLVDPGSSTQIANAVLGWRDQCRLERPPRGEPGTWRRFSLETMLARLAETYAALASSDQGGDGTGG